MAVIIKLKTDTAANFTSNNPTLELGERGQESDTRKSKIGDGSTAWTSLSYEVAEAPVGGSDTQMQYNNSGVLAGDSGFTTDGAGSVSITGDLQVDNINLNGNTLAVTGDLTISPSGNDIFMAGKVTTSSGTLVLDAANNFVQSNGRFFAGTTGNPTEYGQANAALVSSGGITAQDNIVAENGRFSCSPFRLVATGSTTLGSTSASLDFSSLTAYDTYQVHIYASLLTNTQRVLRVHLNGDTTTTPTKYFQHNATTNILTRNQRGIELWQNNTVEGATYFTFDLAGRVDALTQNFQLQMYPHFSHGTSAGSASIGGNWSDAAAIQIDRMTFEIFSGLTSNTVITATDDVEIAVEIYGATLANGAWTI